MKKLLAVVLIGILLTLILSSCTQENTQQKINNLDITELQIAPMEYTDIYLPDSIEVHQAEIDELRLENQKLCDKINSLQAEILTLNTENKNLLTNIENQNKIINDLTLNQKEYLEKISQLYTDISKDYNNYITTHSSNSQSINLFNGKTVPSELPIMSDNDIELLRLWYNNIQKLNELSR